MSRATPLPKIGAPATRALAAADYHCLEDLDGESRADLLALHGVGPRAIRILDAAMSDAGVVLRD